MPWPDDVHRIPGLFGHSHLLIERGSGSAVIVDTGLIGEVGRFERALRSEGLGFRQVRAILLTHGHLDHAGNLAELKERTGAPVFAHPAEQEQLDGVAPYRGWARVCQALEAFGRSLLRYRPARIDVPLADGDELPFWGGLRAVHLPGHTLGHCGYWSASRRLLFAGDLFASYFRHARLPPPIFNRAPERFAATLAKARALGAEQMLPSHYWRRDAGRHRDKFLALCARREAAGNRT